MIASVMLMSTAANSRAVSLMSIACRAVRSRSAAWYGPIATSVVNSAVSVCCAVRVEPTFAPSALTSLKSFVYSAEVNAGGSPGRNCVDDVIVSGFTWLSQGSKNGGNVGGAGRHTPGPGGTSNVIGAF